MGENNQICVQSYAITECKTELRFLYDKILHNPGKTYDIFFEVNFFDYFYGSIDIYVRTYESVLRKKGLEKAKNVFNLKIEQFQAHFSFEHFLMFKHLKPDAKSPVYILHDSEINLDVFTGNLLADNRFSEFFTQNLPHITELCQIVHQLCILNLETAINNGNNVFVYQGILQYDYIQKKSNEAKKSYLPKDRNVLTEEYNRIIELLFCKISNQSPKQEQSAPQNKSENNYFTNTPAKHDPGPYNYHQRPDVSSYAEVCKIKGDEMTEEIKKIPERILNRINPPETNQESTTSFLHKDTNLAVNSNQHVDLPNPNVTIDNIGTYKLFDGPSICGRLSQSSFRL